eukprot:6176203-Pleurochrysis_carterae.AAC.1
MKVPQQTGSHASAARKQPRRHALCVEEELSSWLFEDGGTGVTAVGARLDTAREDLRGDAVRRVEAVHSQRRHIADVVRVVVEKAHAAVRDGRLLLQGLRRARPIQRPCRRARPKQKQNTRSSRSLRSTAA